MPISTPAERSLRKLVESGERPFPSHPQVDRYFAATAIEDARKRLCRAIDRGDGPGLVIGAAGMGKSLLLQALAAQFHQRFDVVLLGCSRICTRRALLQAILFELGLPHRLRDEGRLRLTLLDHLLSSKQAPTELLLLVDEAQTLPVTLLDELRVMTNLVHGGVPRVRLVVAGSPLLEETFAGPELESLSQRVAARCYLSAFSRDETAQFIRAQLYASGVAVDEVLRPEAWEAVFEATDGVPRLVNQLCDRAITVATAENCKRLDRRVVQEAWADLQQLPSPWQASVSPVVGSESIVEFGGLSDDMAAEQSAGIGVSDVTGVAYSTLAFEYEGVPVISPVVSHAPVLSGGVKQSVKDPSDPFSEAFDEEEVVLDNFASMASLFSYGAPRVENRREPEFASLVRAAITAAADESENSDAQVKSASAAGQCTVQPEFELVEDLDLAGVDSQSTSPYDAFPVVNEAAGYHVDSPGVPDPDDLIDELDPNWPPIRLAFSHGSDAGENATSWDTSENDHVSNEESIDKFESEWPAYGAASVGPGRETFHFTDKPVLIVEDENVHEPSAETFEPAHPQVRRQEYRRLFSRLRSG